ncbi:3'(2'),5'-bisphosphate nucleotidase CysQ [uncultured Ilyobacter sp.]|uniref:3'(2'),5'-bisphosphate nucleotidase CysQ n=1 Tax=uncultured Ilyobacter sp. TaxID=544433 RepID=UPI0029BFCD57|nr:3'(2'),5'-bisphosphate nucleotidase CysQ [uncultured Ilyobacter sp.]
MLNIIKKLAVEAGIEIMKIYESDDFGIESKGDESPLTRADKKANEIIVKGLKKHFSDMAILSEEEKDNGERLAFNKCFIVDPLDGTKEFIKRNGEFTVNIALSENGKSTLGVIYVPVTKEIYFAQSDKGSYYEKVDLSDGDISFKSNEKLLVTDKTKDLTIVGSKSHMSEEFKKMIEANKNKISDVKSFGSSLKGCMVAKGVADLYYRFGPTMEWDTAAMQCVVEEAGAMMKFIDHTEIKYNRKDSLNKGFYIINKLENKFI